MGNSYSKLGATGYSKDNFMKAFSDNWEWEQTKESFLETMIMHPDREGGGKEVKDTGGHTKWGISKRAHPDVDIGNLSKEDAKKIYRKEYLHRGEERLGRTHEAFKFMDMEVNMGYKNAMGVLQGALNSLLPEDKKIDEDGGYGEGTKRAISFVQNNFPSNMIIGAMIVSQKKYYNSLPGRDKYGGWKKRAEYNPIKDG